MDAEIQQVFMSKRDAFEKEDNLFLTSSITSMLTLQLT